MVTLACCLVSPALGKTAEDKKADKQGATKWLFVDLQPYGNQKLKEDFPGSSQFPGNNMAGLPQGEQSLEGVKFKIGECSIQLTSTEEAVKDKPEKVEGIKVNSACTKLHILHATGWRTENDTLIGEYTVTWEDGTSVTIPIVYGKDVVDWWHYPDSEDPSRSKVAWKGENDGAKTLNATIQLFLTTWENPKPEKKIKTIDYSSTKKSQAAPFCVAITAESAEDKDKSMQVYEIRTHQAEAGKLDALHTRFRDHTCKLFEKHGMTNVGYWTPVDNKDNKLIYILAFPSKEARDQSWKGFMADPDWQKAYKESEVQGKLVGKVESVLLSATDFSPAPKPAAGEERLFELRVYTASDGNLDRLLTRFRDHTCKLFEKHGITNVGYWTPLAGQKGAEHTLIYILAHKDSAAAKASWDAFRNDPDWIAARKASEDQAGGSLTAKDGVKSTYLKSTDYSTLK
jgi:hypothetical protein